MEACLWEHFVNLSVLGPNYQKVPFWVNNYLGPS